MNDPDATEKILGLDPRALLARARAGSSPDTAALLRHWLPPEPAEIAPLFPQLEITALLGRGGMGAVYRARQPALEREVALKLLPAEAAADAAFAERFRTEARALARLQHPHIVGIYESGQTADGHLFFIMEFVAGRDLAQEMKAGPLSAPRALGIARAVCEALEFAHGHGIIHRDIKPANVRLGSDDRVKVADFGLARLAPAESELEAETSRLTLAGTTLGTPAYMSPEQRAGRVVDGRADLYSLGVMLYEMLTGELPQGAWRPPSHKSDSNARLDAVVEKVMQADPSLRVQSAAELRARLERVLYAMSPAGRRRRWFLASAAGLAAGGAGYWLWQKIQTQATPAVAGVPPPPPRTFAISPPGTYRPLEGLDLTKAAILGHWYWLDDKPGDILGITYTHDKPSDKILELPVYPGTQAFEVTGEVWMEHRGANLMIIFPAGSARVSLVLDLYDHSGLESIAGADWKTNPTNVPRILPCARFLPFTLSVRPAGERVAIAVTMEGQPFLAWEGPQADLSVPDENYPPDIVSKRGPVLMLLSLYGAARVRNLTVRIE